MILLAKIKEIFSSKVGYPFFLNLTDVLYYEYCCINMNDYTDTRTYRNDELLKFIINLVLLVIKRAYLL